MTQAASLGNPGELAERTLSAYCRFISVFSRKYNEIVALFSTREYHDRFLRGEQPHGFLSPGDARKYREWGLAYEHFEAGVAVLLCDTLSLALSDEAIAWYRVPDVLEGVKLVTSRRRKYRMSVGEKFRFQVVWCAYPIDHGNPRYPHQYADFFSAGIVMAETWGERKVGFPEILICSTFDLRGGLQEDFTLRHVPSDRRSEAQAGIVSLAKRLEQKLG